MSTVFTSIFPNARYTVFIFCKVPSETHNIKGLKVMIYEK